MVDSVTRHGYNQNKKGGRMAETAAARKKKQRESGRRWLRENHGVTPDALVTALKKGWAKVVWVRRPKRKGKND